jgi:serine O-acetyltransferase
MTKSGKTSSLMRRYRFMRRCYLMHIPVLPGLVMRYIRVVYSCDIPYTCDLADGVVLCHNALGVVIHEKAVVGSGTRIYQNVTIGGRHGRGSPVIGRNVFIGAGACVLGGVRVGDNAVIGANAVVIHDVPENAVMGGVPAKILKYVSSDEELGE